MNDRQLSQVLASSPLDAQLSATLEMFLAERPPGADEDVHMISAIVDHVIERCSAPGDTVFDPFAGFGTTLERATELGRAAVGIELLPERVEAVREQVTQARMFEGDARELLRVIERQDPALLAAGVDLILTSPPYMTVNDHEADALTAYELDGGDYRRYLDELELVAAQCARLLKPGGYLVWNVADIHYRGVTTHLISDYERLLTKHFEPYSVTEIVWDEYPHDLVRDSLLVFQPR